ncbi:riboflavin synthase [Brachymonas sp. G13]|uniref:riboflavin synthase n=1 Tax=Brachymonas wangyanguii TaxID=3130163 RepID=UPI0016A2EB7D|nr:riboflavin synthase [Ramlibacter sp.]
MFTGIITGVGQILDVTALGDSAAHGSRLSVQAPAGYLKDVSLGDSIAINGACMTVVEFDVPSSVFHIDISAESLDKTAGLNQPGPVNLEKALRASDRLGGHIVSGHVDGIGIVSHFERVGESHELRIVAPQALARFLAYKGSITVNGVSLTVNRVVDLPLKDAEAGCEISINLIPHTVENTALHALQAGSQVNLEIDLMARYCERILSYQTQNN